MRRNASKTEAPKANVVSREDEKLEIRILGGFRISYGDTVRGIGNTRGNARKMWMLFEYLLLNQNRAVEQKELIQALWSGDEVVDPANSLKVLVFKLRRELDSLGYVPGADLIRSSHGTYFFNQDIPHELDVTEFQKLAERGKDKSLPEEEREQVLYKALTLFRGNILEMSDGSPWLMALQNHFARLYRECVEELSIILDARKDYQKVVDICSEALMRLPQEESFGYTLISAYTALEQYDNASEIYRRIREQKQKEYKKLSEHRGAGEETDRNDGSFPRRNMDLPVLLEDLAEHVKYVAGFLVEYEEFRAICHLVGRRIGNGLGTARLATFTLNFMGEMEPGTEERGEHLRLLSAGIAFMAHQDLAFTRSGPDQYAVLLLDYTEEDALAFCEKLKEYFVRHRANPEIDVVCGTGILKGNE